MTTRKVNARDLLCQVAAADGITWLDINGLNSAKLNPGENEETADTTTFSSAGMAEQEIMQRGATVELEGMLLKDDVTGAQDPGQLRCEVLAAQVASASLGKFRFRHPMDTVWKVWPQATFSLGEEGGDNNAKTSWSITITRSGASTTVAAP
jgi:hypothetical protein